MTVLWKKRKENEQHVLVDIGTYGLLTIHGAFKYSAGKSDWNIKKIIKGCYILQDSPTQQDVYQFVIDFEKFPWQFCFNGNLKNYTSQAYLLFYLLWV